MNTNEKSRIFALDVGTKRVGIARTDPLKILCSPVGAFSQPDAISYLIENESEMEHLVVGWPLNMDGSEGATVAMVKSFEGQVKKVLPHVPITRVDERLSSFSAEQRLIEAGNRKKMRQNKSMVDAMAATIILEQFLNSY